MKLSKVQIRNFRSIESATIDFVPSCKALIGIDESGKTNVLHALALLSSDREPTVDDVREPRPNEDAIDEAYIRFVFRLTRSDKVEILDSLEGGILSHDSDSPILNDGTSLPQFVNSINEALYRVELDEQTKGARYWTMTKRKVKDGWLVPKANIPAEVTVSLESTSVPLSSISIAAADAITDDAAQHCVPLTFEKLQAVTGNALISHVNDNLPECVLWSYSDQQLLPPSVAMADFAATSESYEPLRQMFSLAGYEDVAEAINDAENKRNGIRNLLNRVSKAATKHMQSVWKDYKGIVVNVEPNGDNIEVNIKDTYNLYDFSRRSDGFKRFISFLFLVSAKTKTGSLQNVLYLQDEPDTGLHPSGARHLLSELIKVSKENYVVYSTHSIFMIDRNRIDRHYIVTKAKETTTLTQADSSNFRDEEVLFNALEFSAFELLEEENILLEGWKDKKLFECAITGRTEAAKKLKADTNGVGFCHGQGVKDVPKVSSLLEMAKREWIVISDGDQTAIEHQKKYSWTNSWLRYDELTENEVIETSEDFFQGSKVKRSLQQACKRHAITYPKDLDIPDTGKLKAITKALKQSGVTEDVVRAVVSDVKDDLVDGVKPADLRDAYFEVMQNAIDKLKLQGGNNGAETHGEES